MSGITDLIVWREAAELAVRVEDELKKFTGARSAADQMIRAADSIPSNIAEGYGRGVTRDCLRFMRIAHSSADELEGHLRLAAMKKRLAPAVASEMIGHTRRVGYLIRRFEESVERRRRR